METGQAELIVRQMRLEDVPQVHAIDLLSFSMPWTERSYRYELTENPNSSPWVAELGGKVVGLIVIWLILDEAHIGTIAVHTDYRRQGIARRLLATTLIEMSKRGAMQALLEVRRSNLPAQKLYQEFGFQVVGFRPRYYRDNGEDALLMSLLSIDVNRLQQLAKPKKHS
jgi:ribosomal-protein-alanine N-acetyltransferase